MFSIFYEERLEEDPVISPGPLLLFRDYSLPKAYILREHAIPEQVSVVLQIQAGLLFVICHIRQNENAVSFAQNAGFCRFGKRMPPQRNGIALQFSPD